MTRMDDFPVTIELPVLWGHMDAFRHVNNTVYFRYFESVRIVYGDRLKMYQLMEETGIGPILATVSCRFLKPLFYPDTIVVGCRTVHLEPDHLDQEYAVFSQRQDRIAAIGNGKIVAYDYPRGRKGRFPDSLLEKVRSLEQEAGHRC